VTSYLLLIRAFVALSVLLSADLCAASGSTVAAANRLKLSGTIKDALGRPIADAEIRLEEGGRVIASARSDSTGAFVFNPVATGTYTVIANRQGYKQAIQTVELSLKRRYGPLAITMESTQALTLQLATPRLDRARNDLSTEIGTTAYRFDQRVYTPAA